MPRPYCFAGEENHIVVEKQNRLNDEITSPKVRLIGEDGGQVGIVAVRDALKQAEEAGLDLVEIQPNADPPVCRVMDYGKFQFDQNKKRHAAKRKQKQIQIKEVKFRPGTEEGDYQVKVIEMDDKRCDYLAENLHRTIILNGSCSDQDLLLEEGVDTTDVFLALTNNDAANIISSMLAKRLGAGIYCHPTVDTCVYP